MNLIADTNIWYDIASGRRDPSLLKRNGQKLTATPTSLLEISSNLFPHTFPERQAASRAVVDHADYILDDSETHLANIWGLNPPASSNNWSHGFAAIAGASSLTELSNGVPDFNDAVIRKLDFNLTNVWKNGHWKNFKEQVEDAIDAHCNGYKAARQNGKAIHMKKDEGIKFKDMLFEPEAQLEILLSTYVRALAVVGKDAEEPTQDQLKKAMPLLDPYIEAYSFYLFKCATCYTPEPNDLGDLECFVYLQDQNRLLTSDTRWIKIVEEVAPEFIFKP